jgi:hypothetical protein
MITPRKCRANQINSRASTGPKSAKGKARAAANAYRHGLAVPVWSDPELSLQADALARRIADDSGSQDLPLARSIAEAQIDLVRVRRARRERLAHWCSGLHALLLMPDQIPDDGDLLQFFTDIKNVSRDVQLLSRRLEKIDRYEKRAISRRNRAIDVFDASCLMQAS